MKEKQNEKKKKIENKKRVNKTNKHSNNKMKHFKKKKRWKQKINWRLVCLLHSISVVIEQDKHNEVILFPNENIHIDEFLT